MGLFHAVASQLCIDIVPATGRGMCRLRPALAEQIFLLYVNSRSCSSPTSFSLWTWFSSWLLAGPNSAADLSGFQTFDIQGTLSCLHILACLLGNPVNCKRSDVLNDQLEFWLCGPHLCTVQTESEDRTYLCGCTFMREDGWCRGSLLIENSWEAFEGYPPPSSPWTHNLKTTDCKLWSHTKDS